MINRNELLKAISEEKEIIENSKQYEIFSSSKLRDGALIELSRVTDIINAAYEQGRKGANDSMDYIHSCRTCIYSNNCKDINENMLTCDKYYANLNYKTECTHID